MMWSQGCAGIGGVGWRRHWGPKRNPPWCRRSCSTPLISKVMTGGHGALCVSDFGFGFSSGMAGWVGGGFAPHQGAFALGSAWACLRCEAWSEADQGPVVMRQNPHKRLVKTSGSPKVRVKGGALIWDHRVSDFDCLAPALDDTQFSDHPLLVGSFLK